MRCKTCHYSLANLMARGGEHRCPECGSAFDPRDPSTYEFAELAELERKMRFPYDIHRQPVRIVICLAVSILGAFIINSVAVGTPPHQRWQLSVEALRSSLVFVPFMLLPAWWGSELAGEAARFVKSRFKRQ